MRWVEDPRLGYFAVVVTMRHSCARSTHRAGLHLKFGARVDGLPVLPAPVTCAVSRTGIHAGPNSGGGKTKLIGSWWALKHNTKESWVTRCPRASRSGCPTR